MPYRIDKATLESLIDKNAIIDQLKPQLEAELMKIMSSLMADWERRAIAKAPVGKRTPKAGARARKIELRPASQQPKGPPGPPGSARMMSARDRFEVLRGGQNRLLNARTGRPYKSKIGLLARVSRNQAYLKSFRFTKEAGFLKGRSPAAIGVTARGGLVGYTAGQLSGHPSGTLKKSIHIKEITLNPNLTATGVIVADAPYALYVHEGFTHWKSGKRIQGRKFLLQAAKEVEANLREGRYRGGA